MHVQGQRKVLLLTQFHYTSKFNVRISQNRQDVGSSKNFQAYSSHLNPSQTFTPTRRVTSFKLSQSSSKRTNTLLREGIGPAGSETFSSRQKKGDEKSKKATAQCQKMETKETKFIECKQKLSVKEVDIDDPHVDTSTAEDIYQRCISQLSTAYDRKILDQILQDVIDHERHIAVVRFEDIAALKEAKRILQEAIVLPLLLPEFFTGIRQPWRVLYLSISGFPWIIFLSMFISRACYYLVRQELVTLNRIFRIYDTVYMSNILVRKDHVGQGGGWVRTVRVLQLRGVVLGVQVARRQREAGALSLRLREALRSVSRLSGRDRRPRLL